jgi:hypothetical protein
VIYFLAWQVGDNTAVTVDGQRLYLAGFDAAGGPQFTTDKAKATASVSDSILAYALRGLDLAGDDMD